MLQATNTKLPDPCFWLLNPSDVTSLESCGGKITASTHLTSDTVIFAAISWRLAAVK
jgi:hypothetical protein